jgi:carbohydrate-binding DOMON domain-containing protein
MWSLERACIIVYSPSGNYVRIDKPKMNKLNFWQRELIWKCADAYNGTSNTPIELTREEMSMLVAIANIAGTVYKKPTKTKQRV